MDYIEFDEDRNIHLIQNHKYYQIQTRLGVSNNEYCDFFVYTSHGYYLEKINFNENLWAELVDGLTNFWKKIIALELLHKNIYTKFYMNNSGKENENKMRTL